MNKKRIAQYCCAALVTAGVGLNIQNAIENYGIGENSLSLVATGGSGSSGSSSCVESVPFSSCSYSNTEDVTATVMRCGSYAGLWHLKGKRPKLPSTGNPKVDLLISGGLFVGEVAWEMWGDQLTHYEWETTKDVHTHDFKVIDGVTYEKLVDMRSCGKVIYLPGSSCSPIGYSEIVPGSTKWVS